MNSLIHINPLILTFALLMSVLTIAVVSFFCGFQCGKASAVSARTLKIKKFIRGTR